MSAQFRYAPIAGVTYSDLKFKQDIFPVSNMVGAQAGIQGELMFPGIGFGLDFGLIYNMMGAKCDIGTREIWSSNGYDNTYVRIHTIDIPFHLRFKWTRMNGFEDYLAPFVYGGPDFTLSVGHSKSKAMQKRLRHSTFLPVSSVLPVAPVLSLCVAGRCRLSTPGA